MSSNAVSTWLFYRVGSRNESPGMTGASHWCEHMLFKGGGKLSKGDVHRLVSAIGGRNNAFTDNDITAYYETLPAENLEVSLFIESERMANSEFSPTEVESERQVIISEREGSENYPTYELREKMFEKAYAVHPYRWPVVGWKTDLLSMTREDLYLHYKKYYHPNNATLVICGNFDSSTAFDLVRRYFSGIPAGEETSKSALPKEPEQKEERIEVIRKPGTLDYLGVGFHLPRTVHKDTPGLLIMTTILGGWRGLVGFSGNGFVPRSNRLYTKLVEGGIASEVDASFPVNIDAGLLHFMATITPGRSVKEAREILVSEIDCLKDSPPTKEEMDIAFNQVEAWHAYETDGVSLKALSLGLMEVLESRQFGKDLIRQALETTPEEVQRMAKKYLREDNRTVCIFESEKREVQ